MKAVAWWDCTHREVGLPGCPTCDGRLDEDAKIALREARDEIKRLRSGIVRHAAKLCRGEVSLSTDPAEYRLRRIPHALRRAIERGDEAERRLGYELGRLAHP